MSFRFRKSVRLAPGIRLNFGKAGITSLSVGGRGGSVSIGKKGVRTTSSLPGTGIAWSTLLRYKDSPPRHQQEAIEAYEDSSASQGFGRTAIIVAASAAVLFFLIWFLSSAHAAQQWTITKRDSAASGNMACSIMAEYPNPLFITLVKTPDGQKGAFVTAVDGDDKYPGTTVYLAIDGHRFSGEEHIYVTDDLLIALLQGTTAHMEWTSWPYGVVKEAEASLAGLSAYYEECAAFMR